MHKTKERAQGGTPERVESDIHERTRTSHASIVPQPALAWPIRLTIGGHIELIASSLGPIGVFVDGAFVANISPGELCLLGESALSLAQALDQDRAARDWTQDQLAALRAKGRC